MKTKKVLLGSLVLAGVISSCTDEQIVDSVQGNAALSERTQVNLTLKAPSVESRMSAGEDGWSSLFETHDVLGAVLVDGGFAKDGESVWNNVKWTVVDGHVGNNKWAWNPEATEEGGAFVTNGTTAIGSWLFYTKYNEKMTTTRNGVEFDFPQIQEGSDDQEWLLNNNANFMISPVIHLAGYEGQKIDFDIEVPSVFTYLRMPFNLSATGAESVSKIIVKAKSDENTNVKFPTQYRVVNENIEKARMVTTEGAPEEIALPRYEYLTEARELEKEMARAYNAMIYSHIDTDAEWNDPDFKNTVEDRSNGETTVDYLVVDFEGEHADKAGKGGLAVVDGKFSAMMLMPAGEYHSITFDIYTDKGVYTVTVDERDEFYNNLTAAQKANYTDVTVKGLFLRPGRRVMLSDIANKFGNNVHEEIVAEEYIKVTKKLEEENVTFIITKTADLINYIDGIKDNGTHNLTIITQDQIGDSSNGVDDEEFEAHTAALINKAVMDALVAKEAKVGDIQLVLNSNNPVKVVGEATAAAPLYIHDITFNNSCVVVSGNVTVGDAENNRNTELIIPEDQKMLVKGGVNLVLNNRYQEYDNF